MSEEILKLIKDRGLLLEKAIYDLLNKFNDIAFAEDFLERLERISGQKMITSNVLGKNVEMVKNVVDDLTGERKEVVESVFVKMGLSLEVVRKSEVIEKPKIEKKERQDYKLFYADTKAKEHKLEVKDFVGHFRARYQQIQKILMQRQGLTNLTSINKISSDRKSLSIIGIVSDKRVTKNKNLIITFEDLTGKINALVKADSECFSAANELQMDDIVALRCSGNNEILFAYDVIFPDAFVPEKIRFNEDISIAFLSDIHAGSNKHLSEEFERFIEWINSNNEFAKKIKYIFIVGDNVDGVGVFPGQEAKLELTSLRDQYNLLASYLKKIPKEITVFMCPGQHDSVRVAEPQPPIDFHYGRELYEIENLVLVPNPALIKLVEGDKEFKVQMYHGGAIHPFINNIEELRLAKAHSCPARAVKHMLKRRHMAPMHGISPQIIYVPNGEVDHLVISEVPDVFCTGEVHRLDIDNYNGVLIITGSCWQAQTDFEEKVGNVPDPCKVPVFNLKSGEMKIFDFSEEGVSYD